MKTILPSAMAGQKPVPEKQAYEKPEVRSEQMFQTASLDCGKCSSGPFPQFACDAAPMIS